MQEKSNNLKSRQYKLKMGVIAELAEYNYVHFPYFFTIPFFLLPANFSHFHRIPTILNFIEHWPLLKPVIWIMKTSRWQRY